MDFDLPVVLQVEDRHLPKVRYVLETLLMAAGVSVHYRSEPPLSGPWVLYGASRNESWPLERCLAIAYRARSWDFFEGSQDIGRAESADALAVVLPGLVAGFSSQTDIAFDLPANAFYFLASWSERIDAGERTARRLYADSVFARLGIQQDIVDQYLQRLLARLSSLCARLQCDLAPFAVRWPAGSIYALVLSHDVDFLPAGALDVASQGARTLLRHLVRHRDPIDAARAAFGLARCVATRRDPYGCIPEIIAQEKLRGVRSSFQVAVAHRHPADVNYRIEDDFTCSYLETIVSEGFDLCLHGSYRSTENPAWYAEEVELLARRLARPLGSRQHFLSFDYDALFSVQERTGIQYDMSMGFPDRPGPRAGFSYPYYPYCLAEDRPYDVVQIGLFIMDVTLRGYMGLKGAKAWAAIEAALAALRSRGGCASVVWHPIVFGGARDPGYDRLYWKLVEYVTANGGLATDGRTINRFWRERSAGYSSFSGRAS